MVPARIRVRLTRVVLATIAGLVWIGDAAVACSAPGRADEAESCCEAAADRCCCEPGSSDDSGVAIPSDAAEGVGRRVLTPRGPCACPARAPIAPASKPRSPDTKRRPAPPRVDSRPAWAGIPSGPLARSPLPAERPPRIPIYLRASRLLI